MSTYRALTYCQDAPDLERYDYGDAYGRDREAFLTDLRRHLEECAHHRRRVVDFILTIRTDDTRTDLTIPTNAAPGQLPDIAAVLAAIPPEVIDEEEQEAPTAARPPSPVADIVGWTYEADHHCPRHALARFGSALTAPDTTDREGNPLAPVFRWDEAAADFPEVCIDCIAEAIAARCPHCYGQGKLFHPDGFWYPCSHCQPASHSDQDIDRHNAENPWICTHGVGINERCPGCDASNETPWGYVPRCGDCGVSPCVCPEPLAEPRQCVTASGVQFMLPGEEPPAVKKGDDIEQTRIF